jgi:hypothetical protein
VSSAITRHPIRLGFRRAPRAGPAPRPGPRCRSTRWLPSVSSSSSQTSCASKPSTSRSVMTSRWRGDSPRNASATVRRTSTPTAAPSGDGHARGNERHPPAYRSDGPRNLRGSTVGPSGSWPTSATGTTRCSRAPRDRARLARIQNTEVRRGRAALEPVQTTEHREPRVLHHFLHRSLGGDVRAGHRGHHRSPRVHHGRERRLVPGSQGSHERRIAGSRASCSFAVPGWPERAILCCHPLSPVVAVDLCSPSMLGQGN